jgi:glycerol-3-phosphate acyltransferase PlsY
MEPMNLLWVALGYLVGSLSGARIVGRIMLPHRTVEDMTVIVDGTGTRAPATGVSPSTLYARSGPRAGLPAAAIDISKSLVPTLAAVILTDSSGLPVLVAAAALIGHVFPVYHQFKGGFGISPILGALLAIDPWSLVVAISLFGLLGLVLGSAYLAIEMWPVGLIGWFAVFGDEWELGYAVLANVVYWSKSWREGVAAYRSWLRDSRSWRQRVADFKTYPDYEAP